MMNGFKSFGIAMLTAEIMEKEGISNDYYLVTKYFNALHKHKDHPKVIYMAYDSETKVSDGNIWDEIKYLDTHPPHLILTVDKTSYKAYKRAGFNTHYIPIGYDDIHWEDKTYKRYVPASFIGTIDKERNSIFYLRYLLYKRYDNMIFSNQIKKPEELNKIYSKSVLGINDIILGINQRCFEIPINGACMVVNEEIRTKLNKDFPLKEDKHYLVWDSIQKLDKFLLDMNNKENREDMIAMGQAAKEVIKKYPYSENVKEMIRKCKLKDD